MHGAGDCREFNYCSQRGTCVNGRCECWPGLIDQNCTEALQCLYWHAASGEWRADGVASNVTNERNAVVCETSHLTDFAGVLVEPPPLTGPTFPTYAQTHEVETSDGLSFVDSTVPQAASYLFVLDVLTTALLGMALHHCRRRKQMKSIFEDAYRCLERLASSAYKSLKKAKKGAIRRAKNCARCLRGVPAEAPVMPLEPDVIGSLKITLERGEGLPAGDANGLSDPYVVLTAGGQTKKSKVKWKTLNPIWNETFEMKGVVLRDVLETGLKLRVMDRDLGTFDDLLGHANVTLEEMQKNGEPHSYSEGLTFKGKPCEGKLRFRVWWEDDGQKAVSHNDGMSLALPVRQPPSTPRPVGGRLAAFLCLAC
jgi:hypothetical protein